MRDAIFHILFVFFVRAFASSIWAAENPVEPMTARLPFSAATCRFFREDSALVKSMKKN